ncbi:unnamed protein product [Meloidogyne enterolobii]|uniref:Uncharacterized protein n=1 Tax=Meloidogyne enterolobii TaxID=390850 RepID=A0ACB1AF42_MELEN
MSSFHFSSKVLNLVDTRPKADELKGAVKLDPNLKEYLQFGDESVKKSILINQSNCLNSTTFVTFSRQLNTHFIMRPTVLPQILVHLTEMLVGILGICSDSSSVARRFGLSKVPRFFRLVLQLERPFYDLFRILVELFCRTWKDMNAKFGIFYFWELWDKMSLFVFESF